MEYLEDYLSDDMIDNLGREIAKRDKDEKFIISILSHFENDDQAEKLLAFLKNTPEADRGDIIYCTVGIYNKYHNIK